VTAKTKDGKEIFNTSKIYMPQSPAKGRGDKMVYGPHRKSGMLADTTLQPGKTVVEEFAIPFPAETKEMEVTVNLWHLPAGGDHRDDKATPVNKGKYLFHETTTTVTVK
jgi:hypothetical protein